MVDLDAMLQQVPDVSARLTNCGMIGPHGLPEPVVVSLARRPDRWQGAQRTLARHGIEQPIKANAVDGRALDTYTVARLLDDPTSVDRPLVEYLQLTRPAVGCYLSHLAIWRAFIASGEPHVLVLEDDAVPTAAFAPDRNRALMASLPADADLVLLGCTIMDGLAEPTPDPAFSRVYYYNGTYAYLLTRKGAHALLPHLLPLRTHIDNQISLTMVAHANLKVYCCEPRLFGHDFEVYSDVYVPVADTTIADRTLQAIFDRCRGDLTRAGAKLFPKYAATREDALTPG